jgi:DNA helicase-2/ATP-dependent DNA helicase PcrA
MTLPGEWQHLLAGCDEQQHAAITTDAAPLLVVAGAGSGKTRVLTRRIARRVADGSASPARVLALTFTRKAAGELRQRLRSLGLPEPVTAGTFHAVALAELRRRALDRDDAPPVVLDSKTRLLARLLPDRYAVLAGRGGGRTSGRSDVLAAVATEIEWAKARCVTPDRYVSACDAVGRTPGVEGSLVVELYGAYEREKRKRKVLDFDDLLSTLASAIEQEPDFAAAQRWRFRHLFVDELQDANAAQLRLLDAWLGGREDLCAVGDPRQAIYGWNGADAGAVASFPDRYPGATVIRLDANYRSTPQVVAVATAALDRSGNVPAPTHRPDGHVPTVTAYDSDEDEAGGVATALRRARRPGHQWSSCAVLARTNAQLVAFEVALAGASIPYRSGGGIGFLARPAVRAALDSVAERGAPAAFVAFVDDLELYLRALDRADEDDDAQTSRSGSTASMLRDPAVSRPTATPEALVDLGALARLGRDYCSEETRPTADGFLAWARAALRSDSSPGESDAVTLSTFHRAKGLEWPVVFVTGLEDGFVPITQARTPEAVAEERRLLYVALSRAGEELHCSWARRRTFGSRAMAREPSPFLGAVEAARQALERLATPDREAARRAIAASRAHLAGEPGD